EVAVTKQIEEPFSGRDRREEEIAPVLSAENSVPNHVEERAADVLRSQSEQDRQEDVSRDGLAEPVVDGDRRRLGLDVVPPAARNVENLARADPSDEQGRTRELRKTSCIQLVRVDAAIDDIVEKRIDEMRLAKRHEQHPLRAVDLGEEIVLQIGMKPG